MNNNIVKLGLIIGALFAAGSAQAACSDISRSSLETALKNVVTSNTSAGFNLPMWMTFVDESGTVCSVVTSGHNGSAIKASEDKWLGSRVISAQKANTANAFSLNGVAISSGALYAAVQPGASLFGLQESNPVDATQAYSGSAANFGTSQDPLAGKRIGGINVFGGGLAVYKGGHKVGAIGVSGDTSCTDHAVAWQVRNALSASSSGGTTALADFPSAGGFETLNMTGTYTNLGDHPYCPLTDNNGTNLDNNAARGFK